MLSGRWVSSVRVFSLGLLLVGIAVVGAGCATTGTGPVASAPAQIAVNCAVPVIRDEATHLVDDVASALETTTNWQAAIDSLGAAQYERLKSDTWPAIKCAIGEVLSRTDAQLTARALMEQDAAESTQRRHDRAYQWLTEHPGPAGQ